MSEEIKDIMDALENNELKNDGFWGRACSRLSQQLQKAKEENEYRDNMLCEQIEIWRSNCDVWMNQSNKFEQQNKQMRVALENVKFEAEFNGNDESLQKIINIVDNTLKGVE